ncbi:cold and drought-regulated protein CORA-like isoform X2 [Prunus dulcis]|uniref:cold and drought-regulated protein CORA-like isoform X2 n=1 Tax=Prunus dulcis TaxID=3755 RepID=UPI0014822DBA|nr:cold and drought-regulated protein CORA-like isoform X2 [Prunus dulcis]
MASSKAFLLLGLVFAVLLISYEVSAIPTQSEESMVNGDGRGLGGHGHGHGGHGHEHEHGGHGHGHGGYGHGHGGYGHGHHGKGGPGAAETEIEN